MAKDVKVAIIGDASRLKSAFKDAEQSGSQFQSSMDGISAKTIAIGAAMGGAILDVANQVVDLAQKGIEWLPQLGAEFDHVSDKLNTMVGAGAAGQLNDQFNKLYTQLPNSMGEISGSLAILWARLQPTNEQLDALTTQLSHLATITGGDASKYADQFTKIMLSWGIPVDQASSGLEDFMQASRSTAIPVEELMASVTGIGPQLQELGFGFTDALGLLSAFQVTGVDTSSVLAGFNKYLKDTGKEGKDSAVEFQKFFAAIKDGDPTAIAQAYAAFGKGAAKIVPALQDGRLSIDDITGAIKDHSQTINDTYKQNEDWPEKWSTLWHSIEEKVKPIADNVFAFAGELLDVMFGPVDQNTGVRSEGQGLAGAWQLILDKWAETWPKITKWYDDTVKPWIEGTLLPKVKEWGDTLGAQFGAWLGKALDKMGEDLATKGGPLLAGLAAFGGKLGFMFVKGIIDGLKNAIPGGAAGVTALSLIPGFGPLASLIQGFDTVEKANAATQGKDPWDAYVQSVTGGKGGVGAHAGGGFLHDGWNVVGERGRELVNSRTGSVIPSGFSMPRSAQSSGVTNITVNTTHPGTPTAYAIRREMRKHTFLAA